MSTPPTESTNPQVTVPHHPIADPDYEIGHEHTDVSGGWLRPAVFGVVDGLVSNFALIAGVSAASSSAKPVVLAGVAGLIGGAFSMGTGEYVSVRSQNESMQAEVALERHELEHNVHAEMAELVAIYVEKGLDLDLARKVVEQLHRDPQTALEAHAREELGLDIHDLPSPYVAAFSSFFSFSVGALVPLMPFLFAARMLPLAGALALIGLFATGAMTARFTVKPWWYAGGRQTLLGLAAALVTFGIGNLFGTHIS